MILKYFVLVTAMAFAVGDVQAFARAGSSGALGGVAAPALDVAPLPYLAFVKPCTKSGSSKAAKKKFAKCQLKAGKTVEKKGCRLGGCHILDASNRFAGITKADIDNAIATQPLMVNVKVKGKDLSYLLKYFATLQ